MATIHWSQGISGQFTNALDWSPKKVPGATDDVVIVAPGNYTVTVSANITIRSLATSQTVTLAVGSGDRLTITHGTSGPNGNAGTITLANGGALEIGGTFDNTGSILLNSTGRTTALIIAGTTALDGTGVVQLSDNSHNEIVGLRPPNPFLPPTSRLTVTNTIEGAGTIGTNLTLNNEGRIIGDGTAAALILNTANRSVSNSGVIDGSTAEGVTVVSNVVNDGILEAAGTNASLTLDGAVTNTTRLFFPFRGIGIRTGAVEASGAGAHVDLSSASITGGTVAIGTGSTVQTVADSGLSSLTHVSITGEGTLQANQLTRLTVTNSTIATTDQLVANGLGSEIVVNGTTGAVASTIDGGKIEFNGASAANVSFTPGAVGTLTLDSTFTGTVSGLAADAPTSFSNLFVFGDSTVDAGALQYLSADIGDADLTARLQNALLNGGTDSPVGVGQMNPEWLAGMLGLSDTTAYAPSGGNNYAISGALDAADFGNAVSGDPGNGGLTNSFLPAGTDSSTLLSTVAQIQKYLSSTDGVADPSALYFISSGANDLSYAESNMSNSQLQQYLKAQANSLTTEIDALYNAGARHILVNDIMNNNSDGYQYYSSVLFNDLNNLGILYTNTDGREMNQTVIKTGGMLGFNFDSVSTSDPALVNPDPGGSKAFGIWGGVTQDASSVPLIDQNSYLLDSTSEQTHFFSDTDGHLSNGGQQLQATYNFDLLTDDVIDLPNQIYDPLHTQVTYTGTTAGGTLTVSNATQSESIALLGDYTNANFVALSDGNFFDPMTGQTGTLVMDTGNKVQLQ